MPSQTSAQAYYAIKDELGLRQRQVLVELCKQDLTSFDLATRLGIPLSSITGRINELCAMNLVIKKGTVLRLESKKHVTVWGIPLDSDQLNLL